jgi:hypothetical protein
MLGGIQHIGQDVIAKLTITDLLMMTTAGNLGMIATSCGKIGVNTLFETTTKQSATI